MRLDDIGAPDPGGDSLGFIASGTDNLNYLPPNFESYQPLEYNFSALTPFPDNDSLFSACADPGFGQHLPSFPDTFGPTAGFPTQNLNPLPPNLQVDFIPPRDFLSYHASAFPPQAAATTNIANYDNYDNAGVVGAEISATQMPMNQSNPYTGDAINNFSGASGAVAGRVCPFAPPTFNLQRNPNPTPPQSTRSSTNSLYLNSLWNPSNPRFALPPASPLPTPNTPTASGCTRDLNNDDYVATLLNGGFPSPSLPPPSSNPLGSENPSDQDRSAGFDPSQLLETDGNMPRRESISISRTAASSRPRRRSSASMVDLTSPKTERDDESPLGVDTATPMAPPPSRKRRRPAPSSTTPQASSRRPSTSAKSRPIFPLSTKHSALNEDDDLFGDNSSVLGKEDDDDDVLDLTGSNEVPAELLKPKVDNRVKLSKFQCSICMDEVSDLTVTHCGT